MKFKTSKVGGFKKDKSFSSRKFSYKPQSQGEECECGKPLIYGHECALGFWNGRQFLRVLPRERYLD